MSVRKLPFALFSRSVIAYSAFALAALVQAMASGVPGTVTPVQGESWLVHLNRSQQDTSMGKTGRFGPPPGERAVIDRPLASPTAAPRRMVVGGADLYRMNCRGCHGEAGTGAPPEIGNLINPVRSTSSAAVLERMKALGMPMTRAEANQLAAQARKTLFARLHRGGDKMPAFEYLREDESRALYAYLKQLAGLPRAQAEQVWLRESDVRVGELIVRSTCHICHSASGVNPSPQELLDGAIPPLSTLKARVTQEAFIVKVTRGAPVLMGPLPALHRGRMPVFHYLSEQEALAAYRYLADYPPQAMPPTLGATVMLGGGSTIGGEGLTHAPESLLQGESAPSDDMAKLLWLALFSFALLVIGVGISVREIGRAERRRSRQHPPHAEPQATRQIVGGI